MTKTKRGTAAARAGKHARRHLFCRWQSGAIAVSLLCYTRELLARELFMKALWIFWS